MILGFTLQPTPGNWTTTPILEDRLRLGLLLYQANISQTFILSGGWGTWKSQAEAMTRWFQSQLGSVNSTAPIELIKEGRSNTTFQNAEFSLDIVKERGFKSVAVVTSSFHQYRSRQTFCSMIRRDPTLRHIKVCLLCSAIRSSCSCSMLRRNLNNMQLFVAKVTIAETGFEPWTGFYHWVREIGAILLYIATGRLDPVC